MPDDVHANDAFKPADPDQARADREHLALGRITQRHASTAADRFRPSEGAVLSGYEAASLVADLAAATAAPPPREPAVDATDLVAALSLIARARAEVDALEASLLFLARADGLTWAQIAFGLGLRSGQAAQQRCDRLIARATEPNDPPPPGRSSGQDATPGRSTR